VSLLNNKTYIMKSKVLLYTSLLAMPFTAFSQDSTSESSWKDKLPFEISGSVDVYTQTNFTPKFSNEVSNEAFSYNANSFNLGMANLMMKKDVGKVGFMVDLAFGPRAGVANGDEFGGVIKQLYITYRPAKFVELTMGNFSTFFGYELIEPTKNFQYSTSLAFQNGPFYHSGLKANFTKDKFNFLVAVMNQTDTKEVMGRNKFVGSQLGYTAENGGIFLNYVGGSVLEEGNEVVDKAFKHSLDITGTLKIGKEKAALLGLNAALHYQHDRLIEGGDVKSKFYTTYLYAQGPISKSASIGGRVGYFGDPDALAGIGSKNFYDFTVNANLTVGPLTFIPEVRVKYAEEEIFFKNDGSGTKIQPTMLLAAVISF
jgi:hypothetical protein